MLVNIEKFLKQYSIDIKVGYGNIILMFYMDQLMYFHNQFVGLHKDKDKIFNSLIKNRNQDEFKKNIEKLGDKLKINNNNLLSFFSLFIIELAKDIEMKENGSYNSLLDINIKKYSRIKYNRFCEVKDIKDLITHYRDALVHSSFEEISDSAMLKERIDTNKTYHLKPLVKDHESYEYCFMIGDGRLNYSDIEKIMKSILFKILNL